MQPSNRDFADAIRASFAAQSYMASLAARLIEIAPGYVVIEAPVDARFKQQTGLIHGGVIGALGETAGGYAAMTLMPAGFEVVTVEYKVNFMRPARGTLVRASGTVVRAGRSVTVARMDVAVGNDGALEPVAILQGTFMRIDGQ